MKKLTLDFLKFEKGNILNRSQLKNILGGSDEASVCTCNGVIVCPGATTCTKRDTNGYKEYRCDSGDWTACKL